MDEEERRSRSTATTVYNLNLIVANEMKDR